MGLTGELSMRIFAVVETNDTDRFDVYHEQIVRVFKKLIDAQRFMALKISRVHYKNSRQCMEHLNDEAGDNRSSYRIREYRLL